VKTFQLAQDHLKKIDYDGPVALSCDDTKLLASFRPYYDKELDGYFVMGHTGKPFQLLDPTSFSDLTNIQDSKHLLNTYVSHPMPYPME